MLVDQESHGFVDTIILDEYLDIYILEILG